jgi:hypothetical protein
MSVRRVVTGEAEGRSRIMSDGSVLWGAETGFSGLTCGSAVGTRAGSGHARCLCLGLCFTSSCVASSSSWCCSVVVTAPRR